MRQRQGRQGTWLLGSVTVLALVSWATLAPAADVRGTWGVGYATPQRLTGSLGLFFGRTDDSEILPFGQRRGVHLQVEPGQSGGSVSLGFADTYLSHFATRFYGWGLRATALRTWGTPIGVAARQTYAGVELDGSLYVRLRVGVLWHVAGDEARDKPLLVGSVGFGF